MVREVPRLVSDPPCSSVLLSVGVLPLSAGCGAAGMTPTGAAGSVISLLGVTWKRPTVTEADRTSVILRKRETLESVNAVI